VLNQYRNVRMGGGTFFKVGGHKCTLKNYRKFLWFVLATVTSQALKYYVITYTPYEGLNYTILNYSRNGNCPLGWTSNPMFYTNPLLQKAFSPIWIMFQKIL